jgi:hypothetical protein
MKKLSVIFLMILCVASVAQAQATRTWVSGVGDDVNPCSRTAPCKTWAGAISKTADKGEIDALDPGGFGTVNITKSMTLDGAGTMASTLYSGTNGILVNDTSGLNQSEVTIRNLSINGGGTGLDAIRFSAGKRLTIDHCNIFNGTGDGLEMLTTGTGQSLEVRDSTFENLGGMGLNLHPTQATSVIVSASHFMRTTGQGIQFNGPISAQVSNTSVSLSATAGIEAASTSNVNLDHVRSTMNVFGVFNSGGTPTMRLKDCLLTGNSSTGAQNNAGTMTAFQSNVIQGTGGVVGSVAPQ